MSLLTGAVIGALAVCIWQVIQLTRRVEKLEDELNKALVSQENQPSLSSSSSDDLSG